MLLTNTGKMLTSFRAMTTLTGLNCPHQNHLVPTPLPYPLLHKPRFSSGHGFQILFWAMLWLYLVWIYLCSLLCSPWICAGAWSFVPPSGRILDPNCSWFHMFSLAPFPLTPHKVLDLVHNLSLPGAASGFCHQQPAVGLCSGQGGHCLSCGCLWLLACPSWWSSSILASSWYSRENYIFTFLHLFW